MPFRSYRKESKTDWGTTIPESDNLNLDQIQTGAILRIADAAEAMSYNFVQMQNDLEMYKRWYTECRQSKERMARRISALQGVITRMKKKVK
jgi:hypothetical protein